jgi:hypothetical protein
LYQIPDGSGYTIKPERTGIQAAAIWTEIFYISINIQVIFEKE